VELIFERLAYQVARTLHYISATIQKYEIDDAMLIDLTELAAVFEGVKGLIERQKGRWRIVRAIMASDDLAEADGYSSRLVVAQTFYMFKCSTETRALAERYFKNLGEHHERPKSSAGPPGPSTTLQVPAPLKRSKSTEGVASAPNNTQKKNKISKQNPKQQTNKANPAMANTTQPKVDAEPKGDKKTKGKANGNKSKETPEKPELKQEKDPKAEQKVETKVEKGKAEAKSEEKKDEEEPGEPGNIDKKNNAITDLRTYAQQAYTAEELYWTSFQSTENVQQQTPKFNFPVGFNLSPYIPPPSSATWSPGVPRSVFGDYIPIQ